jgi:septum formation topological specificity factor MinE
MSVFLKMFGVGSAAGSASRAIAKDRLSVILASQRGSELLEGVNVEELQRDVLAVVQVCIVVNVSNLVVLRILL